MKVDILTKQSLEIYMNEMRVIIADIHKNIQRNTELIYQLQDRIAIMEADKYDKETEKTL